MNKIIVFIIILLIMICNSTLSQFLDDKKHNSVEFNRAINYLKSSINDANNLHKYKENFDEYSEFDVDSIDLLTDNYIYDSLNYDNLDIDISILKNFISPDIVKLLKYVNNLSQEKENNIKDNHKFNFLSELQKTTEDLINNEVKKNLGIIIKNILLDIEEKKPELLEEINNVWKKKSNNLENKLNHLLKLVKLGLN